MAKTIDERVKAITLALKEKLGEASLDLYYDNYGDDTPFVVKVHSALDKSLNFHARGDCFDKALDLVVEKFDIDPFGN